MYLGLNSNLRSQTIINFGVLSVELYIWVPDCLTFKVSWFLKFDMKGVARETVSET